MDVGPIFDSDSESASIQENSAADASVSQYQASHSNTGESLTYFLSGGDLPYFTIDNNAQLKTSAALFNYENLQDGEAVVEIAARDNNGNTDTITLTISLTDERASAGEPPCACGKPSESSASDPSMRVTWAAPNTPSGTSITGYDLQFRDVDSGRSWIPLIVTGTDRSHTIENLAKGTEYELQVKAQNDSSGHDEWTSSGTSRPGGVTPPPKKKEDEDDDNGSGGFGGFIIVLVNNDPKFLEGSRTSQTIVENAPQGTDIGEPVAAVDEDGDALTYTLRGVDAEFFYINSGTGQIEVLPRWTTRQGTHICSGWKRQTATAATTQSRWTSPSQTLMKLPS